MSITLSIPSAVVRGCRFLELARRANVKMPKGWRFNSEECEP